MSKPSAFAGLEPALVREHFTELTRIARPSKEEAAAREHVLAWAAAARSGHDSGCRGQRRRASPHPGAVEKARPRVVLQSHLDMVRERDPDSPYDLREGRINVVVDGDWVLAQGTTLGADNGIGVAASHGRCRRPRNRARAARASLHRRQRSKADGAKALDPSLVAGRILVNLDGTSDNAVTVGCAGSVHTFVRMRLELEPHPPDHVALEVVLSGAHGGHSGGDIASGRVNAIKALGRVLARSFEQEPFRLASFSGGVSRNAIPREARAAVSLEPDAEPAFRAAAEQDSPHSVSSTEASTTASFSTLERVDEVAVGSERATSRALDLITAIPTGVIAMSPELLGVVETSTSLTIATTDDEVLTLASMTRSSNTPALEDVAATIAASARLAGAAIEIVRAYPPWRPDLDSRLLRSAKASYSRLFAVEPALTVVHGGLECAIIGGKLPGVEMISLGPEIVGPHAPGERLSISGTQRFYRLLGALLDDLSR